MEYIKLLFDYTFHVAPVVLEGSQKKLLNRSSPNIYTDNLSSYKAAQNHFLFQIPKSGTLVH